MKLHDDLVAEFSNSWLAHVSFPPACGWHGFPLSIRPAGTAIPGFLRSAVRLMMRSLAIRVFLARLGMIFSDLGHRGRARPSIVGDKLLDWRDLLAVEVGVQNILGQHALRIEERTIQGNR